MVFLSVIILFIVQIVFPLASTTCLLRYLLQNFKREEQNFVVMNEINNMSFLTADSKSKMSKVRADEQTNGQEEHKMFYLLPPHPEL